MLTIEPLQQADIAEIASAFAAMGWNKPEQQYREYLDAVGDRTHVVLVARQDGPFAGYGALRWRSGYPPFAELNIPEIVDLNVLPQFRRRGVAGRLMTDLEEIAAAQSRAVGIGVGLTEDYGAAQRLYTLRGYVPDGRGAEAHGVALRYGEKLAADDTLFLHLVKQFGA